MVFALTIIASLHLSGSMVRLRRDLDEVCKGFHGRIGYYVKNLRTNEEIGSRAGEQFPSASTIKTAIMLEAIKQIEEGKLSLTEKIVLPPPAGRESSMWTAFLRDGISVSIDGLVNLMMNVSDNTAAIMLSDKVGVENIERRMLGLGLNQTACTIHVPASNARLTKLRKDFANMGATSPSDMGKLLEAIYRKQVASPAACERMLRIMSHEYWDDYFGSQIPPGVYLCSKVGALNRSRSDIAIVYGLTPYIITVYTDDGVDQSWTDNNEAHLALRKISHLAWNRLNSKFPYDPPKDAPAWYPKGGGVED